MKARGNWPVHMNNQEMRNFKFLSLLLAINNPKNARNAEEISNLLKIFSCNHTESLNTRKNSKLTKRLFTKRTGSLTAL